MQTASLEKENLIKHSHVFDLISAKSFFANDVTKASIHFFSLNNVVMANLDPNVNIPLLYSSPKIQSCSSLRGSSHLWISLSLEVAATTGFRKHTILCLRISPMHGLLLLKYLRFIPQLNGCLSFKLTTCSFIPIQFL